MNHKEPSDEKKEQPLPPGFFSGLGEKLDEVIERLKRDRKVRYATAVFAFMAAALGVVSALQGLISFPEPKIVYASLYDNSVYGAREKNGYYVDLLLYNDGASDVETVSFSLYAETADGRLERLYATDEPVWLDAFGQERPKIQFPEMAEPPAALIGCVWHADGLTGQPYFIGRARAEDQGTGEYRYKLDRRPLEGTAKGGPPDCAALAAEIKR